MSEPTELFYTFGNHHHWVDMEWLWGYDVMSGDIEDMLTFCRETGAKGNVNWEAGGFEKIASEQPEAFGRLRQAIRNRTVEVIGGSYGQPYGLFQGDESNIRQMIYGVRTNMRLFGVRPRSFWEEEFYFFPQLPQILRGVGYQYASLFFQWTWHTPEVPVEESPAIWWEGQDGSRLKTVSRNRLNVHQWPEDIQTVLGELRAEGRGSVGAEEPSTSSTLSTNHQQPTTNHQTPILLQWLELMPTKDWMCRSEVLLPKTLELLADPRFKFRFGTLSDYLSSIPDDLPVRRYGMDEVWHGMSLGKNGDDFRGMSREAEGSLLTAESLCALAALFGRPYAQWDVYPVWEIEEGWRELLMAQHHDNDECEGLCGHVGRFSYERSLSLSTHVREAVMKLLAKRVDAPEGALVVNNPLPWSIDAQVRHPVTHKWVTAKGLPPLGYRAYAESELQEQPNYWTLTDGGAVGRCGEVEVTVGPDGSIRQLKNRYWPEGIVGEAPLLRFEMTEKREKVAFDLESIEVTDWHDLSIRFRRSEYESIGVSLTLRDGLDGVGVLVSSFISRPDPGMQTGLLMSVHPALAGLRIVADQPLGQQEVRADRDFRKKYPTGDWMTSPQWFEDVRHPFTGSSLVDLFDADSGRGLLVTFDRTRQWFRDGDEVMCLLNMYDPWDEDYFEETSTAWFHFVPHGGLANWERYRLAQELNLDCESEVVGESRRDIPPTFNGPSVDQPNVAILAFYREMESAGRDFASYGGHGMAYPYIVRLLELDGVETDFAVSLPGTIASAVRTNLLGEPEGEATFAEHEVRLKLHPFGIATVYVDLVEGRKQVRDLDAHREVWAQVHRE